MGFIDKIFGWLRTAFKWVDLANQWLNDVETNYPGLITIIKAIWDSLQDKITQAKDEYSRTGNEVALDAAKAKVREEGVTIALNTFKASPRFIPEPVIRAVWEMITLKHGDYEYYDLQKVKEHALYWLSKRG